MVNESIRGVRLNVTVDEFSADTDQAITDAWREAELPFLDTGTGRFGVDASRLRERSHQEEITPDFVDRQDRLIVSARLAGEDLDPDDAGGWPVFCKVSSAKEGAAARFKAALIRMGLVDA